MEIVQTWISARGVERPGPETELVAEYMERSGRYCACRREGFAHEDGFWEWVERGAKGRTVVVVLDGGGRQMSSEAFAAQVGRWRDEAVRRLVLGIGGADGWTAVSRGRADVVLSLGPMTLPHQMARVVLAEQVYRALTILAGHPYHTGH